VKGGDKSTERSKARKKKGFRELLLNSLTHNVTKTREMAYFWVT